MFFCVPVNGTNLIIYPPHFQLVCDMIPVLSRVRMHKLLLGGDMNSRSLASFFNEMLQLRDKAGLQEFTLVSSLLTHLSLTPLPTLTSVPSLSRIVLRDQRRTEQGRIISGTEMLGLMARDKVGWFTSGAAVVEAEMETQVESLTRPQI